LSSWFNRLSKKLGIKNYWKGIRYRLSKRVRERLEKKINRYCNRIKRWISLRIMCSRKINKGYLKCNKKS